MIEFLSGIMKRTPRMPPTMAMSEIERRLGSFMRPSFAHKKRTGSVKMQPAASDSPAEPIVCTMLLSRTEFRLRTIRVIPIAITAAGIDAEIVIPTRRPRYAFAAPKTIASRTPETTDVTVNSGVISSAGT